MKSLLSMEFFKKIINFLSYKHLNKFAFFEP